MNPLAAFARLLGLQEHQAEDALHSERAARLVVTRRLFLGTAGALGAAALLPIPGVEAVLTEHRAFSFPIAAPLSSTHLVDQYGNILQRWLPGERIESFVVLNIHDRALSIRLMRVRSKQVLVATVLLPVSASFVFQANNFESVIIA